MPIPEAAERYLALREQDPHITITEALENVERTSSALAGWRKKPEFRSRELYLEELRARDTLASTLRQEYELAQAEDRLPAFIATRLTSRQEMYLESMLISYDNAAARDASGLTYSEVQQMLRDDPSFRAGMQEIEAQEKEKIRDRIIREATEADLKLCFKLMEKLEASWAPTIVHQHQGQITHTAQAAREESDRWAERPAAAIAGPQLLTAQTPPKVYRDEDEEPS